MGQADLRRILYEQGLTTAMDRVFGRIRSSLRTSGHERMPVVAVVMIGEGCAMPAVQEIAKHRFPSVPIHCNRPLEAVARGAALYCSPVPSQDRIRNDYTLRYWDPESRGHRYRFSCAAGPGIPAPARWPGSSSALRMTGRHTSASRSAKAAGPRTDPSAGIELVSDAGGRMRLAGPAPAPGGTGSQSRSTERT